MGRRASCSPRIESVAYTLFAPIFKTKKAITSFKFATPAATGTITEAAKTIAVSVPTTGHRYTVEVTNTVDETTAATDKLTIGTPPEITSINKSTFAKGEQIVLKGQGLKVDGISPFLYFMPDGPNDFRQGVGKVNAEGTEITFTIPASYAADKYELSIDYDGETIKKFDIVIQ